MKLKYAAASGLLASSFFGAQASDAMLRIVGDTANPQCREAAQLAADAFASRNPSLIWPIPSPANSRVILAQGLEDISGGDALTAAPDAFVRTELAKDDQKFVIYGRSSTSAARLYVLSRPHGWQGDWYTVHLVPTNVTPVDLANDMRFNDGPANFTPRLDDNRWSPPIVLTNIGSGTDWLIDRGEPFDVMPDWKVYVIKGAELVAPCRISFGLRRGGGLAALPSAVRKYAAALNAAIGSGDNEGTLHPTARIRMGVEKGWANVALRPWASATPKPYNSLIEVRRGLESWASGSKKRAEIYRAILNSGPAERALQTHIATHFGWSAQRARAASKRALQTMLRASFVFPSEEPNR